MKFSQKNIENWRSWKTQFFWVGHFDFFFWIFAFCFISMKKSQSLLFSKDGSKFWWLPLFPAHEVLGQHLCTRLYILDQKSVWWLFFWFIQFFFIKIIAHVSRKWLIIFMTLIFLSIAIHTTYFYIINKLHFTRLRLCRCQSIGLTLDI